MTTVMHRADEPSHVHTRIGPFEGRTVMAHAGGRPCGSVAIFRPCIDFRNSYPRRRPDGIG